MARVDGWGDKKRVGVRFLAGGFVNGVQGGGHE